MSSTSYTWPHDVLITEAELPRHDENNLRCFLACAFRPEDRADDLMKFIQMVCDAIGKDFGARIECVRGDQISNPGTIHTDIWQYIQLADALIFDVTGLNGNVLLELGVAAAIRPQASVIIIRDIEDQVLEGKFLFDIAPTRCFTYRRSLTEDTKFAGKLRDALVHALTPAPYIPPSYTKTALPLKIDLTEYSDPSHLLSPPSSHRRTTRDGLEFGSLFVFRNSWLMVGKEDYSDITVKARLRISKRHSETRPADGWIGVSLCSSHFFANYSHLVYVKPDGSLWYYEPQDEFRSEDKKWGQLTDFTESTTVEISVSLDKDGLSMEVNGISNYIPVADIPFRRRAGKIRIQTHLCRAILEHLEVSQPV